MNSKGLLFVATAGVAWGTGGVVASVLYSTSGLGPVAVSFWRLVFAAIILLGFLAASAKSPKSASMPSILFTGIALAIYQTAYYGAVAYAGIAVGTVITLGACPVLTAIGARLLLNERLTMRAGIAVAAAVGGVILLTLDQGGSGSSPALGVALALLSAVGYTAVTLHTRAKSIDQGHATMIQIFLVATLCLAPLAWYEGLWPLSSAALGWMIYLGAVPTVLAYRLFFAGLAMVPATTAAVITLIEPLTAAAIAVGWMGERLTISATAGAVLILGAAGAIAARGSATAMASAEAAGRMAAHRTRAVEEIRDPGALDRTVA